MKDQHGEVCFPLLPGMGGFLRDKVHPSCQTQRSSHPTNEPTLCVVVCVRHGLHLSQASRGADLISSPHPFSFLPETHRTGTALRFSAQHSTGGSPAAVMIMHRGW